MINPKTNTETWAWQHLPPSVIFGTMDLIPEDHETAAHKRNQLTQLVELLEAAPATDHSLLEPGGQKPVTIEWARRFLTALSAMITGLRSGFFRDEVGVWAPDLMVRYEVALPTALARLRTIRAVLFSALENYAGSMRGESVDQRLDRSIKIAATEEPIDLGSFVRFAEDADEE